MILFIVSVKDACFITEVKKWHILNWAKVGDHDSSSSRKQKKNNSSRNQEALVASYQINNHRRLQEDINRVSPNISPRSRANNLRVSEQERASTDVVQRLVVRVTSVPNFPIMVQNNNENDINKPNDNLLITPPSQKYNHSSFSNSQSVEKKNKYPKADPIQKVPSDSHMLVMKKYTKNSKSLPALQTQELVALRKSYVEKVPKDFLLNEKEREKTLEVILTIAKH
jgi:hypothetical protein